MNFENIEKAVAKARADFESIITNTTLDLDARWDLFSKAPEYLTTNERWIINIPEIDRDHALFDSEYSCSTISIIDRVNDWCSDWEWNNTCPVEDRCDVEDLVPIEEIKIIKEWALINNVRSFEYDW